MTEFPKSIAIIGLSISSLITALQFRKKFPNSELNLTVIGDYDKTQPSFKASQELSVLLSYYDISEEELIGRTAGNYIVNTKYKGWTNSDFSIPLPSSLDVLHNPTLFELSLLRRQGYDINFNADSLFFCKTLADQKRIPTSNDFPFKNAYQYNCDSNKLFLLLSNLCQENHITIIESNLSNIAITYSKNNNEENIEKLQINNTSIKAEVFIDCSNNHALVSKITDINLIPYKQIRDNDQQLICQIDSDETANETIIETAESGYFINEPLQNKNIITYCYCSQYSSKEQAINTLNNYCSTYSSKQSDIVSTQLPKFIVNKAFYKNVIVLNEAYANVEQLKNSSFKLLFDVTEYIITLFNADVPLDKVIKSNSENINQALSYAYEELNAFNNALYLFHDNRKSPYWNTPTDQSLVPPIIGPWLQQWFSAQDLEQAKKTPFQQLDKFTWYCLFSGLSLYPPVQKPHPGIKQIEHSIQDIAHVLNGCALNFSSLSPTNNK